MNFKTTAIAVFCFFIGANTVASTRRINSSLNTESRSYHGSKKLSILKFSEQDTILSRKESRRTKKKQKKSMYKDLKFKIGDGVTVTTGPMKGMYGVFIYYDTTMKYLIRFTGTQQMFFNEEDIQLWTEYIKKNK
ncbi:hypothetical protein SPPR111872_12760 [Sphingobacterium prati]